MNSHLPILTARGLMIGYGAAPKTCPIAGPLDLDIHPGRLICLLGPNGSGKSTLLRTLSGLQSPLAGNIRIGDEDGRLHPGRLARLISLVLTDPVRYNNLSAHALVSLGRYPYSGWLGILSETDKAIVTDAMEATGTAAYADRKMTTLSDGEGQKVMLARALAQDTPLMMLDEPTAHLDLPSRIQLMQLLHQLAKETNKGILVSTHELDLALQVADEVWLLQKGGRLDKGMPEELVLNGVFQTAFDKNGILFDKSTGSFNIYTGQTTTIRFTGEGINAFWTKRALRRSGFSIGNDPAPITVHVIETAAETIWAVDNCGEIRHFTSLGGLLGHLSSK